MNCAYKTYKNIEEILGLRLEKSAAFPEKRILAIDYRGFGDSSPVGRQPPNQIKIISNKS